MGLEIRPAREEEGDEFKHVAGMALATSPEGSGIPPEFTLCVFEDGKLATAYGVLPLTMRFNGGGVPVAGVAAVGTLPIYRRRGYLRKVITKHLALLHEQGERAIAILWAAWAAIYQRYGYAVVSTRNSYDVAPRYLEFSLPQPITGTFREISDDELALLDDLYQKFIADRTGYIHRRRAQWESGQLAPPPAGSSLTKVVYQEGDEPLGYVIYTQESMEGPGHPRLTIRDLTWLTVPAYRAVWNYLANMDEVSNIIWRLLPTDDPLPHLLLEPGMLNITSGDGIMGRIIDVERALPQRPYLEEGTLTFEITDNLCPWNQGRWKLETATEGSSISRAREEAQLVMPISTLAMLVFGHISASEAARMGRLDVNENSALPMWDKVMRTKYCPFCADDF